MPAPLPSLLPLPSFTVHEALELDVPRRRLGHRDLESPHHGLRSAIVADTTRDRCVEFQPLLTPDAAYSHTTAAALWGLPLPLGETAGPLHVVSPGSGRTRRPGLVGHRAAVVRGCFVGGLPVVEPLVAWAQCAAVLRLDDLVAMGDALAGRWSPHAAARELPLGLLARAADDWGRRRGRRRLEEALGLVRPDVWSPRETALRLVILRAGLPEPPERNAVICDAAGSVLGHADLVWRDEGVLAEYEGDQHRTDRRQWRLDLAKYEAYADEGWRVVRVTDDDLVAPARLVRRIARLLTDRAVLC